MTSLSESSTSKPVVGSKHAFSGISRPYEKIVNTADNLITPDESSRNTVSLLSAISLTAAVFLYVGMVVPDMLDGSSLIGLATKGMFAEHNTGLFSAMGSTGIRVLMVAGVVFLTLRLALTVYDIFMNGLRSGLIAPALSILTLISLLVACIGKLAKSVRTILMGTMLAFVSLIGLCVMSTVDIFRSSSGIEGWLGWSSVIVNVVGLILGVILSYVCLALFRHVASGAELERDISKGIAYYRNGSKGTIRSSWSEEYAPASGEKDIAVHFTLPDADHASKATVSVGEKCLIGVAKGTYTISNAEVYTNEVDTYAILRLNKNATLRVTVKSYADDAARKVSIYQEVAGLCYEIVESNASVAVYAA